jgi:L-type amino acid transporter 9
VHHTIELPQAFPTLPFSSFTSHQHSLTMSQPNESDDGAERPLLEGNNEPEYGATDSTTPIPAEGTFKRNLGTVNAFAIVISIVIGSGVFTSPGSIDANVPSPGLALITWLVGGILAWTGASTLAELGTSIPGEGGVQPYLKRIFGDIFGFLAAWTWIVAVMPATLAILSIVFIESIFSAAGVTDQAGSIEHKLLSVLILVIMNAANGISTKASTRLNNFFVSTKFLTILAVVVAGIAVLIIGLSNPDKDVGGRDWLTKPWFGSRNSVEPDGSIVDWSKLSQWEVLGHFSAALYGALWAYSGWDKVCHVSLHMRSCYPSWQLTSYRPFISPLNFPLLLVSFP